MMEDETKETKETSVYDFENVEYDNEPRELSDWEEREQYFNSQRG